MSFEPNYYSVSHTKGDHIYVQEEDISIRKLHSAPPATHNRTVAIGVSSMLQTLLFCFQLFDNRTFTYSYLLADRDSGEAVIIDPVIELANRDLNVIRDLKLNLKYASEYSMH